ncbi:TBC1 domain member [Chamberlinius hualienensis]
MATKGDITDDSKDVREIGTEGISQPAMTSPDISLKRQKLCGFLKTEIGKYFKTVWVVYMEDSGGLLYYEKPYNSKNSSGYLNIAKATFILENENPDRSGLFLISTPDKSVHFEAKDQNAALFWLQELQKRRKLLSLMKTAYLQMHGVNYFKHLINFDSGILGDHYNKRAVSPPKNLFEIPVSKPDDIGEDASKNSSPTHKLFSHIRSHLVSGFNNLLPTKTSDQNSDDCAFDLRSAVSPSKLRRSFRRSLPFTVGSKDMTQPSTSESDAREINNSKFFVSVEKENDFEAEFALLKEKVAHLESENKRLDELVSYYREQRDWALYRSASLLEYRRLKDQNECVNLLHARDSELAGAKEIIRNLEEQAADVCLQNITLREKCDKRDKPSQSQSLSESQLTATSEFLNSWTVVDAKSYEALETEKLKGLLTAMLEQRQFSKSELLHINEMRKDVELREEFYRKGYTDFYAKYLTIQSKLLCVLNDYHNTESVDNQHNVAYALLDSFNDPEAPDYFNIAKIIGDSSPFDIYGFHKSSTTCTNYARTAMILKCRAETLETQFIHDPYTENWVTRWDLFMATFESENFQLTDDIKRLVRTGIPFIYRGKIWKCIINHHVKNIRGSKSSNYYETLLAQKPDLSNPTEKQIMMDLYRTFPHNKYFEGNGVGIPKLRRVLLAFGRHNKIVGYCQGMNNLAALSLLFLSEEDAFWCMVAIIEVLLPWNYYTNNLIGVQVDLLVLKDLLAEKVERLNSYFNSNNIDISLYTYQWFVCIFVEVVPVDMFLNIWDTFLFEGDKVLFRYALAILKLNENYFMKSKSADSDSVCRVLKEMKLREVDWEAVSKVAFEGLNPFRRKMVTNKRHNHYPTIKESLIRINNDLSTREAAIAQSFVQLNRKSQ